MDRPILFSGAMVRALLAGTKTQTRRSVTPQPTGEFVTASGGRFWFATSPGDPDAAWTCPHGAPGDTLWVREAWRTELRNDFIRPRDLGRQNPIYYDAGGGGEEAMPACAGRGRPSIHMPRWASRISLKITDVRVERLNDISEADARAEGASFFDGRPIGHHGWRHDLKDVHANARSSYARLWGEINGEGAWAANPWVWCVAFERVT